MEVDKGVKLEEKEMVSYISSGVKVKEELGDCVGCSDLRGQVKEANDKCAFLELDIGKKESAIECLDRKVGFLELEKLEFTDEVTKLRQRNKELDKRIQDSEEDPEKFTMLMIENEVLNCEKKKAEGEVEFWKSKYKELEDRVVELEKRLTVGTTKAGGLDLNEIYTGTPPISTPSQHCADTDAINGDQEFGIKSRVRKCLDLSMEKSFPRTPSNPSSRPPSEPIYIGDSDDDLDTVNVPSPDFDCKEHRKVDTEEPPSKAKHEPVVEHESDEEETSQPLRTPKRRKVGRGVSQIVSSESDDDIPISRLRRTNQLKRSLDTELMRRSVNDSCSGDNPKKFTRRRRLRKVGDIEGNSVSEKMNLGVSENMNDTLLEDEIEGDDSSSEGESLDGFIVDSSDVSDGDSVSNCNDKSEHDGSLSGDCSDESESSSERIRYDKIMSGLRRERKDKLKWEYESDMLADFGKSAELCMKAICALYRQQTSEEKSHKAALHRNGRGFNQTHAFSGSALAEFLTDGDPHTDTTKTVDQLQKFNPKGVEQCRKLATHYSKQLFEIYKNEEDPFFHP